MGKYAFGQQELETYTVSQLKRLCSYYDIKVFADWSKDQIIDTILKYIPSVFGIAEEISIVENKSVRVTRIEAQMKGFDHE